MGQSPVEPVTMFPRACALLAVTGLLAGCSDTHVTIPREEGTTGMAVVGVGRIEVRPDTLVVGLGVESTAPTAPEALDAMTTAANRMIDAIRDAGVEPEDLQTVSLSVREVRPQPGLGQPVPIEGVPAEDVSVQGSPGAGFVGEQRLRVRIRDLESGGEVIEAAVAAAGADARVFNMSLDVAEPDAAIAQARTKAVEDALARADQLAESAGIELGAPIAIEEVRAPDPGFELALDFPAEETASAGVGGSAALAQSAADIEPGVRKLEVRVLVRFAIDR